MTHFEQLTVMPSLEILDISRNKLKRLPSQPGTLVGLRVCPHRHTFDNNDTDQSFLHIVLVRFFPFPRTSLLVSHRISQRPPI